MGGGLDVSLGYIKNDGLFLLGGYRIGNGLDVSVSSGLSLGFYNGKGEVSAYSLVGEALQTTFSVGAASYSIFKDVSRIGRPLLGQNWTIHNTAVGYSLTPIGFNISRSYSLIPYYLLKK
jgi:hypothetical protein